MEVSERRVDELERYSRCDNFIIRGVPESSFAERASDTPASANDVTTLRNSHKSVKTSVLTFIKDALHVDIAPADISTADISTAHRFKAGTKGTSRPVIVRFTSRHMRNEVYRARMKLRDSTAGVFLSEHLT